MNPAQAAVRPQASSGCLLFAWWFTLCAACGLWAAAWIFLHWIHSLTTAQLDRGLKGVGGALIGALGAWLMVLGLRRLRTPDPVASGELARPAKRCHPSAGRPAPDPRGVAATTPATGASVRAAGSPESTRSDPRSNHLEAGGMGRCRIGLAGLKES